MAASALNWSYIGKATLGGSATIADALDAIYDLFNQATNDLGASRGNATWDPNKITDGGVTIGVRLSAGSDASATCQGCPIILAGKAGTISDFPLMDFSNFQFLTGDSQTSNHTFENSVLYGGLAKNAGSFTSLSPGAAVTPFTSGGWTGFARITDNNFWANGKIYAYECKDAIWLTFVDGSSGIGLADHFTAGGIIDPGSLNSLDGEADNVRYGMISSANKQMTTNSPGNQSDFPNISVTDNDHISVAYVPGATTYTMVGMVCTTQKLNAGQGGNNSGTLPSGAFYFDTMTFNEFHAVGGSRRVIGKWRQVLMWQGRHTVGQEVQSGGAPVGYLLGRDTNNLNSGLFLKT